MLGLKLDSVDFDKVLRLAAGVFVIYFLFSYIGDGAYSDNLLYLKQVQFVSWLQLVFLMLFSCVLLSAAFLISVQELGNKITFTSSLSLVLLNNFYNTIFPAKAGLAIRGFYLRKYLNVSWNNYALLVVSMQVFALVTLMPFVILFFNLKVGEKNIFDEVSVFGFYFFVFSMFVFFVMLYGLSRFFPGSALVWFQRPSFLVKYFSLTVIFYVICAAKLWLSFYVSGSFLDYHEAFVMYCVLAILHLFALIPGNLGVKELGVVAVAHHFGVDQDVALTASLVDRISEIIVTLVFGGGAAFFSEKILVE